MSYTARDVESLIENYDVDGDDGFFWVSTYDGRREHLIEEDDWSELGWHGGRVRINGVDYEWENVADKGGEGQGEYRAIVFSITDSSGDTRLFRKEGYYQSYDGSTWDGDFSEVEAYEKTVTDYREV